MSLGQISRTGAKTPIAGLNGLSGELVPSVSYYQTGSVSLPALEAGASQDITITLPNAMPDNNYVVVAYPGYPAYTFSYTPVSATQFTISVKNQDSVAHGEGLIRWRAFKLMTDESRALDEQAIEDNTSAIAQNTADITTLKTVKSVTPTTTSAYKSGSIIVRRVGNVVQVSVQALVATIGSSDTVIATGLPKAVAMAINRTFNNGTDELRIIVNTSGELMISGVSAVNGWGSLTYVTAS